MFLKTKNQKSKTNSGFSMIELMVAIIIFTIGGLSAYLLVYSAINSSIRSKSEIIASNIARQQIELIKNIRDTNWLQFKTWNKLDNAGSLGETLTGGYYTIENNFNLTNPIKITNISSDFDGSESKVLSSSSTVKLCLDNKDRYTHECIGNKNTNFYAFIKVSPLNTKNTSGNPILVDNTLKIDSIVATTDKGYHEYKISTIITDWKR